MLGRRAVSSVAFAIAIGIGAPAISALALHLPSEHELGIHQILYARPLLAVGQRIQPASRQAMPARHNPDVAATDDRLGVGTALAIFAFMAACCCVLIRLMAGVTLAACLAFAMLREAWRKRHVETPESHAPPRSA
ncbi:hypothetical protein HN371_06455 [Candidatus Poribacteria bacterium]|jgi:hypothetical protein|nr:hypothetical protein [Candidatus Poribacteria bacterium]